jgi:TRAP-type mannitol/chloroaromatic compound transport system permease large subunit
MYRGALPFVVAAVGCLIVMVAFPEIALILTRFM